MTIKVPAAGVGSATATVGDVAVSEASARVSVGVTVEVAANAPAESDYKIQLSFQAPAATGYAPDLVGEVGSSDADVYWDTIARGTPGSAVLTVSWGQRTTAQKLTREIILGTHQDDDAEHEHYDLGVDFGSGKVSGTVTWGAAKLKMTDNETQRYVMRHPLSVTDSTDEGQNVLGIRFEAVPMKTTPFPIRVNLESGNGGQEDYYLTATGVNAISQEFEVPANKTGTNQYVDFDFHTEPNDGDRKDDVVTFKAYLRRGTGGQGNTMANTAESVAELELKVIDIHKLPKITLGDITVPDAAGKAQKVTSIDEGKVGTVMLKANRTPPDVQNDEDIKVTLTHASPESTADRADYTLSGAPVELEGTATSGSFMLDVDADEDVGEEALVLTAVVSGDKMYGTETETYELGPIPFTDVTMRKIGAKTDAEVAAAVMTARTAGDKDKNGLWTPGEMLTLEAASLFNFGTGTSVTLAVTEVSSGGMVAASASGSSVMVEAKTAGKAKVTVSGTASDASSAIPQTVSNVAMVAFDIMVDEPAIVAKDNVQAVADAAIAAAAGKAKSKQWEPGGEKAMIALSDLFDVPASIKPRYLAESSDNSDVTAAVSGANVELTPVGAGTASVMVTAVDPDHPARAVTVEFNATVMAQAAVVAKSQTEVDEVFMKAGAGSLAVGGAMVTVDMSMLYTIAPGTTPSYTAMSDKPDVLKASTSGMTLTLEAVSAGDAMIMVEAVDSASKSIVPVTYKAMVAASTITYMLTGPENRNLVEGMDHANGTKASAMVKVTASRALDGDETAKVMLMRDGASTAGMDDYTVMPEMVMLKAGDKMAEFTVTAVADDMMENEGNMAEMLTLFLVVDDMQMSDKSVMFYIWDAAVPALPIIAQLLLAGLLGVGGYRRYRRR